MFFLGLGGGVSHTNTPAYAKEAVGNCRGTGAQADFSFAFKSYREKLIPQRLILSL